MPSLPARFPPRPFSRVATILAGLLLMAWVPANLRADTTINSGTTTISTGTNFGTTLVVGDTDTATLRIVAGGNAINNDAILGYDTTGLGHAIVTGGTWTSSNGMLVGFLGSGSLDINGGYVRSTAYSALAWVYGSTGTATVTSGTWSTDSFYVGYRGTGDLTVSGGSAAADYQLLVGAEASGSGAMTINGGSVTSPWGSVGYLGSGSAAVAGGSWAVSNTLSVGAFNAGDLSLSSGQITSGAGIIGQIAGAGVGTVTVTSGTWTNAGGLEVGGAGSGTLHLDGGAVGSASTTVASSGGSVGVATVASGTWTSGDMQVGAAGTGSLTISGGLLTNSGSLVIGVLAGSSGTATVGGGLWSNAQDVVVGGAGNGTLNVSGGRITGYTAIIANDAAGVGTVMVTSGTWTSSSSLLVGRTGSGSLQIDGGTVISGNGFVGMEPGSTGAVTVTGGTWSNSSDLTVGRTGSASMAVSGGRVVNTIGIIGYQAPATVTASGGTWENIDTLHVGFYDAGSLTVNGGAVTAPNAQIGSSVGGVGTVTVSSGTLGIQGDLLVGGLGTGTLTMDGGVVTVGGVLSRDAGTINLNAGGTLQIGTGSAGSGISVGNLNNNGTLAFNQSNNYTYSDAISGSGAVTKAGAGTLTLGGANSFTGGVTISGGTLAMGSSTALGNGGSLAVNGGTLDLRGRSLTVNALSGSSAGTIRSGVAGAVTLTATAATSSTYAGTIVNGSGTVALTKSGAGTLTLTGSNTYTGTTTISSGALQIGAGGTTGSIAGNVANNAVLAFNRSDALTYSGVISGTGGLTKSGGGALTLTGSSTYTGVTNINGGTLVLGSGSSYAVLGSGTITFGGGTLRPNDNANRAIDYSSRIKNSSGAISLLLSSGTLTFASTLDSSNTGGLTKSGGGTLTLSASNGYTGVTNVNGGVLALGNTNALAGSGTLTFARPDPLTTGVLQYSGSNTVDYSAKIQNSSSVIAIDTNGQNVTFASGLAVSNTGGLAKIGSGTLTLSASNAYTGVTYVDGGVLALGDANALAGGGTISFGREFELTPSGIVGSGTLQYSASNTVDYSSKILSSGSAIAIDTNGQNVTFATGLAVSNTGGLSKSGLGTLTLSASNAYRGVTTISGGTLQIGNGGTTGSINGNVVNNAALAFNRSNALSFSGTISGSGAVTKLGAGRLTLAGPNTYSGLTTISGGTLALSGSGSIGTGGLDLGTTASPGVFDLAALVSGTSVLPATGDLAGVGTLSGAGKTLAVLGSFLPGNSPGTVTVGSGFTLDLTNTGTSVFEITSLLYTPGTFDLVNGDGSVIFGGTLNLVFSGGTYAEGTNVLQIFANTGGRSGSFSSMVWSGLAEGQSVTFDAGTGSISINAVPEPSTYAMALAGLACGGLSRWRRRKRADAIQPTSFQREGCRSPSSRLQRAVRFLVCTSAVFVGGVTFSQTLTVYGTAVGQSGPAFPGGSIAAGDTVRIDDGGSVAGAVSNSGTLQFNQTSGSLSLTGTYTGSATAMLSLTNGGTVGLLQSTTTTIIDGAVDVSAGRLTTGTSALFIGANGNGLLSISGNGSVATTHAQFASGPASAATFTMSGGTFTNTARSAAPFFFASGSASSGTFTMTGGTANFGTGSGGGLAYGPNSRATMTVTGGTLSWNWCEPAEGDNSVATITVSGSATRLNATSTLRMSIGTSATSAFSLDSGVAAIGTFVLGTGINSTSTVTITGGSAGFAGTGATTNANFIGYGAGSSGTMTISAGTTTIAGPTIVGGLGTINTGGVSRGLLKVEGGLITTNTAASGGFSSVLENHLVLGRYAPTTGEMLVTGGTFTAQRDFYVGGSGTGTLTLSGSSARMQVGRLFVSSTIVSQMNSVGGAGNVTVSSGTLLVTGSGNAANLFVGTNSSGTGSLTINGSGVVIVGGTLRQGAVGSITLGPGGTLQIGSGTSGGVLLGGTGSLVNDGTLVFNKSVDFFYSGVISGSGAFIKRSNAWGTLQSANTYTGLTSVEAGVLLLSGSGGIGTGGLSLTGTTRFDIASLTASTYTLPATGDLVGTGTLSGSGKTLAVLGHLLPGPTIGSLSVDSGLTLDLSGAAGSTFDITSPAYTVGTFDLVSGSGSVVYGGVLNLAFSNGPYANGTDVVRIFANTGGSAGNFTSVMATGLGVGQYATFNPMTRFVSIVPEPSTYCMALAGIACGGFSMWRRRKRA